MFRNMNVRSLWIDLRGSVAVEFSIISVVLLIFMFFVADLVMRQATVGKLDRLSYSIAGVLRERIQLYDRREDLSLSDIGDIYQLANRMIKDMNPSAKDYGLQLKVQQLFFEPRVDLTDNEKHPVRKKDFFMTNVEIDESRCQPLKSISELQDLSPRGSYGRWVPLYQVTLCLTTNSWYTRLIGGSSKQPVIASSAVVMLR